MPSEASTSRTNPADSGRAPRLPAVDRRHVLPSLYVAGVAVLLLAQATGWELPEYWAAFLACMVIGVLPGLALARILAPTDGRGLAEALALAVPFSVVLMAPLAAAGFLLRLDMKPLVSLILAAGFVPVTLATNAPALKPATRHEQLLLLLTAVIVLSPLWLRIDLSRDWDDWWYLGYVRQYMDATALSPRDPVAGPDAPVSARTAIDVWLLAQGAIARLGLLNPVYLVQTFLPPAAIAAALLAVYALTRRIARDSAAALLATIALIGVALIDVAPHEGFGRTLFVRAAQDKVVSGIVVGPSFLLLLLQQFDTPGPVSRVSLLLAGVALAVTHPHGLILVAGVTVGFVALELLAGEIRRASARRLAFGALAIAALMAVPAFFWLRLTEQTPGLFNPEAGPRLAWRILDLPGRLYTAHPGLLRNPLLVLAIVLSLAHLRRWREDRGARLLIAATWAPILLILFPPSAVVLGKIMSPSQLWRMLWIVPAAPILGAAAITVAGRLTRRVPAAIGGLAILALAVALGAAAQQGSLRLDRGYFAGPGVVIRRHEPVVIAGLRYLADHDQRVTPAQDAILRAIARRVPAGARVMADLFMARAMTAYVAGLQPVSPVAGPRSDPAVRDRDTFFFRNTPRNLRLAILARNGISHVLVARGSRAERDIARRRFALRLYRNQRYALYRLSPPLPNASALATFGDLALWRETVAPRRLVPELRVRLVWTSPAPPAPGTLVRARLVDTAGATAAATAGPLPFVEAEVPFRWNGRLPVVSPGEYQVLVTVLAPDGQAAPERVIAHVTARTAPDGFITIEARPVAGDPP